MSSKKKLSPQEISILARAFKRSRLTISRWVDAKDDRLTSKKASTALDLAERFIPKSFKKGFVYLISGKRYLCLLSDETYSCLCPIIPHRSDGGYKTILSKSALYSTTLSDNGVDAITDGSVREGVFYPVVVK